MITKAELLMYQLREYITIAEYRQLCRECQKIIIVLELTTSTLSSVLAAATIETPPLLIDEVTRVFKLARKLLKGYKEGSDE